MAYAYNEKCHQESKYMPVFGTVTYLDKGHLIVHAVYATFIND